MKRYLNESWINPKVEVRNSRIHGKGLFAKEQTEGGEVVVILGGNFVSEEEALKAKQKRKALQQIDDDVWEIFDYHTRNEDASYNHNHSCNANTWMKDEVTIIARRNIKAQEELTIDYAFLCLMKTTRCKEHADVEKKSAGATLQEKIGNAQSFKRSMMCILALR